MSKLRLALTALVILLIPISVQAGTKTLQNETLTDGSGGTIQAGFIAGDIGVAVLEADPGDYPITILTVEILIANTSGMIDFRDYIITIYDNGAVNPGAPVYTSGATTLAANAITQLDVSGQGIVINSGRFSVGASPVSGGIGEPNLVTDVTGCTTGKNRIRDVTSGLWFDGCVLGISGQLAIRAVVDITGGGGGSPPQVLAVVPAMGPVSGGTTVTVIGNDFVSGAVPSFGGADGTGITFIDANRIEVITPPGSGTVDVMVCNPDLQCDTLSSAYEYEATSIIAHTGTTSLGDLVPLSLLSPDFPNKRYLVLCSRTLAPPGIPLSDPGDNRVFPINFDFQIFEAMAGGSNLFRDFAGRLDGLGDGEAKFKVPGLANLVGLQLHFAFGVLDSAATSGVLDISNVTSFTIDP